MGNDKTGTGDMAATKAIGEAIETTVEIATRLVKEKMKLFGQINELRAENARLQKENHDLRNDVHGQKMLINELKTTLVAVGQKIKEAMEVVE